ncbi:MAG: beta-ketoacyl synthase [Pseudomonadales bacterium]|nr:beta-ketoacyl synthase [Pseudomonadales bacterium]
MTRLPVVVGFGGVNPAGRVSHHHAFRRLIVDKLSMADKDSTYASLAQLMNIEESSSDADIRKYIDEHTLIRKIESFDTDNVELQKMVKLSHDSGTVSFQLSKKHLPRSIPDNWQVKEQDGTYHIQVKGNVEALFPDTKKSKVSCAGQLPSGFEPGKLYPSRSHPRGLQLAVYGASDAVGSIGIDWQTIKDAVKPDEIAVYAASAMGQMDYHGNGGLLKAASIGKRVSSKNIALGLVEMPGDFVNAYVLGNVGSTGAVIGACATYLYNLNAGIEDIKQGKRRVVIVGNSEAGILPEIIDGFSTMRALAEDDELCALDGIQGNPDYRRASRPFAENCGFTLAEASIYTILMDDELALEMGANIHCAVPGVYINADGFKKSIPGPGIGNYITMGKALGLTRSILGDKALNNHTCIHAHGTGTPQNRVTESQIMDELAGAFGISNWPVAAIKAYLGHPMAPASGDQLVSALGTWAHGWLPGISTMDEIASDVYQKNLNFSKAHLELDLATLDATLINSKGFGGNNATGVLLSPNFTSELLKQKHGQKAWTHYLKNNEAVAAASHQYDVDTINGKTQPVYKFGDGVLEGEDLEMSSEELRIPGFEQTVSFAIDNPFALD